MLICSSWNRPTAKVINAELFDLWLKVIFLPELAKRMEVQRYKRSAV
jgi:hypothetical protein